MITVNRELEIEAPAEKLWEILADFGNSQAWAPNVNQSALTKGDPGVGCERECAVSGFGDVTEKIVAWEEGEGLSIRIEDVTMMQSMQSNWSLTRLGADRTRVSVAIEAHPKFGPMGALMGALMMKPKIGKTMEATLQGLRYYALTGESVGAKVPELAVATA
jgi:uncharacterized membrane protein